MEVSKTAKLFLRFRGVALDSMVFIYLFNADKKYYPIIQTVFDLIESNKIKGITSVISPLEALSAPALGNQSDKLRMITDYFLQADNLTVIDINWEIMVLAAELRRKYLIRTPDALQLATAICEKADSFLTNDEIFRKIKDFPILFLSDLTRL